MCTIQGLLIIFDSNREGMPVPFQKNIKNNLPDMSTSTNTISYKTNTSARVTSSIVRGYLYLKLSRTMSSFSNTLERGASIGPKLERESVPDVAG